MNLTRRQSSPSRSMLHPLSRGLNHAGNGRHDLLKFAKFKAQLLPAGRSELVIAGTSVVLRLPPLAHYPALDQPPLQRGIERAFFHREHVVGELLDALGNAVPVPGAALQGL